MSQSGDGSELRLRLARESYGEVLDATKHQDDKIGRFLTAIAFLFTGAIAFGSRTDLLRIRYQLDEHVLPLPALLLGLFLMLSVLSVLLLIVGIGPNLQLPRPERDTEPRGRSRQESRLFFLSIAGLTIQEWKALWTAPQPLPEQMIATYVRETHNLATKTDFKYSRTNEARAVFTLGLMFLALAVALGFDALSDIPEPSPAILPWNERTRLFVAGIFGAFSLVLSYDYLRLEQELGVLEDRDKLWYRLAPLYVLPIAVPAFVVAMVFPGESARSFCWIASASAFFAGAALVALGGREVRRGWLWRISGLIALGLGLAASMALQSSNYLPRLGLALLAIGGLESPRLLKASALWSRRRRRLRQRRAGEG